MPSVVRWSLLKKFFFRKFSQRASNRSVPLRPVIAAVMCAVKGYEAVADVHDVRRSRWLRLRSARVVWFVAGAAAVSAYQLAVRGGTAGVSAPALASAPAVSRESFCLITFHSPLLKSIGAPTSGPESRAPWEVLILVGPLAHVQAAPRIGQSTLPSC